MKNIKKITAAVLSAAMIVSAPVAFADEVLGDDVLNEPAVEHNVMLGLMSDFVKVSSVANSDGFARIVAEPENGLFDEIVFNISDATIFMDNVTGAPASIESVKEGDRIYVYYSSAMTRSLPPQSAATAVLTNIGDKAPARLITAEEVTQNEDGSISVLSDDGSYVITVNGDTPVSPFKTKNIVTTDDIVKGTRFFAWFEVMTLSLPAQVVADKVVILPEEAKVESEASEASETRTVQELTDVGNMTVAEFLRLVVIETAGEQPIPADTHYAMGYMNKAVESGLITADEYPQSEWDSIISKDGMNAIIDRAVSVMNADKSAMVARINAHMADSMVIDGEKLSLDGGSIFLRNGNLMVPLRVVAEALGFTVEWDEETNTASLDNGEVKTTVQIGLDSYYMASSQAIGHSAPFNYGAAPTISGGKTYVPVQLFSLLYSNPEAVSIADGVITITSK